MAFLHKRRLLFKLLKEHTKEKVAKIMGCPVSFIEKKMKTFRGYCTCCGENEKGENKRFLCEACFVSNREEIVHNARRGVAGDLTHWSVNNNFDLSKYQ